VGGRIITNVCRNRTKESKDRRIWEVRRKWMGVMSREEE